MQSPIVHRRLPIPISQHDSLINVHIYDSKKCNWKQAWYKHPVHETNVNHHDNGCIFIMHHVNRTWVELNVCLLSNTLSFCSCSKNDSTVHPSLENSQKSKYNDLNPWHKGLYDHGLKQTLRLVSVPILCEIWKLLLNLNQIKRERSKLKSSVGYESHYTCIDEGTDHYNKHDNTCDLTLSFEADLFNNFHIDDSKYIIDSYS